MATKTTPDAAPEQAPPQPAPTPAHGGSYLVDEQTGDHTLIERTQDKQKE